MGDVRRSTASVDDQNKALAVVGDHNVIQDAGLVVKKHGVALAAGGQAQDVARD